MTEKVHESYLNISDKIIGNVMEKIPTRLKHEVQIFEDKTFLDSILESFEKLRNFVLEDLNFSKILRTMNRNKSFIVFSCTGFLMVYYSVSSFVNQKRTIGRQRLRGRVNIEKFSNPFELFFGYCLHQTRTISDVLRKDEIPSILFVATVLLVTFKLYVRVEYNPDQDFLEFKYIKN